MNLWLDDVRRPWDHGAVGYEWAKTADEAIDLLKTGMVKFASLDHDLAWEHYCAVPDLEKADYQEKTGYDVVCWMEENNCWPIYGVQVHSMNPVGRIRMNKVIEAHYGRIWP